MTTIFGPDISSYQSGLTLSRLAQASFVIAKTTEGTYYTDADYQAWRGQAAQLGKPFVWYHFLSGEDAAAQAAHNKANVGDLTLPGMLDAEPAGNFRPTLAQIIAYVRAAHAAGLRLVLVYLPRWYWEELGSPDLSELASLGVHLVSSAYPGGTGSPSALYPGNGAAGWQSYGGMTPLFYQFTDKASDGGQSLDYNAFRGTVADLTAVLLGTTTPTSGGTTMPNIPPSIAQKFPDIAGDFPPNAPYTDDTAIIWADAGARAAALYAREARDAVNALAARIGQPAPAPTVDVNALAAALAPHLTGGVDPNAVAQAVVAHLGLQVVAK